MGVEAGERVEIAVDDDDGGSDASTKTQPYEEPTPPEEFWPMISRIQNIPPLPRGALYFTCRREPWPEPDPNPKELPCPIYFWQYHYCDSRCPRNSS